MRKKGNPLIFPLKSKINLRTHKRKNYECTNVFRSIY